MQQVVATFHSVTSGTINRGKKSARRSEKLEGQRRKVFEAGK